MIAHSTNHTPSFHSPMFPTHSQPADHGLFAAIGAATSTILGYLTCTSQVNGEYWWRELGRGR
ncbi:MAG: hypothetical protein HY329_04030 [Chloroflexi bacterium]|nr:hypothetical protein [Chloroflexota bacterium]